MLTKSKKIIALLVSFIFVLSLVPTVAMAETTEVRLKPVDFDTTRKGHTGYWETDFEKQMWIEDANNSFRAYMRYDLTGYEEILGNENTTVEIRLRKAGGDSWNNAYPYEVMLMNDHVDGYVHKKIDWANADTLGLHGEGVVVLSSGETYTDGGKTDSAFIDPSVILNALNSGFDNSIITMSARSTTTNGRTRFYPAYDNGQLSSGIFITYDASEIDNQKYVNTVAENMAWTDISKESIDAVTSDLTLPAKYHGTTVSWASDDQSVINPDTGKVTAPQGQSKTVTLTASLEYKGLSNEAKTATAPFKVTVAPEVAKTKTIKASTYTNTKGGNSGNDDTIAKSYGNLIVDNSAGFDGEDDRVVYMKWDLAGYEKYLDAATSVSVTLNTVNITNPGMLKMTVLSDNFENWTATDSLTELTYNIARDNGLLADSGFGSAESEMVKSDVEGTNVFSDGNLADAVKMALADNPDNTTVNFRLNGDDRVQFRYSSAYINIEYYESNLKSDAEFFNSKKGTLAWSNISKQDKANLIADLDLPDTFWGYPVAWTTTNSAAVDTDGTVGEGSATLTATIEGPDGTEAYVQNFEVKSSAYKITLGRRYTQPVYAVIYAAEAVGDKTVVVASYNDGELVEVTLKTVTIVAGENLIYSYVDDNNVDEVKVMLWESAQTMTPLCPKK